MNSEEYIIISQIIVKFPFNITCHVRRMRVERLQKETFLIILISTAQRQTLVRLTTFIFTKLQHTYQTHICIFKITKRHTSFVCHNRLMASNWLKSFLSKILLQCKASNKKQYPNKKLPLKRRIILRFDRRSFYCGDISKKLKFSSVSSFIMLPSNYHI